MATTTDLTVPEHYNFVTDCIDRLAAGADSRIRQTPPKVTIGRLPNVAGGLGRATGGKAVSNQTQRGTYTVSCYLGSSVCSIRS